MDQGSSGPSPIQGAWNPRHGDSRGAIAFYIAAMIWMLFAPAPAFLIFGLAIALPVVEAIMSRWGLLLLYSLVLAVLLVLGKRSVLFKRLTIAAMVLAGLPLAGAVLLLAWVLAS